LIFLATEEPKITKRNLLTQGSGTYFFVVFFVIYVLTKGFSLAFNKLFTNILPKEDMGDFAIIVTASATILTYASLGFGTALNRYTVAYRNKNKIKELKNLITSGFIVFIVVELLIVGILVILYLATNYSPWFLELKQYKDAYLYTLLAVGGIVVAQFFSTICYNVASSLQNSRYYAIPVLMRVLLQIPFSLLFVLSFHLGVFGLVLGLLCAEFLVGIYSAYRIIRDIG